MSQVAIIGAGLAGSLLAIYLAKRGIRVAVYEARGDMRTEVTTAGRSINLALSNRGIAALREVNMDEYMLANAVPMFGRLIHPVNGETKLLPYSGRQGEYINSVSRADLNIALMNEAERYGDVEFFFGERCIDIDFAAGKASFETGRNITADSIIAADGAGSVVRQAMQKQVLEFSQSSVFLEHGYKELHIPPDSDNGFRLEKNALHIWPRNQFMMIALPNFDGSFTCTLFLAHNSAEKESDPSFEKLVNDSSVQIFFESEFPDVIELMPTLLEDFARNPTGNLGTIKCWPWNTGGKVLLLGDAAHAVVPFYGQGMNCAFEDVRVLDDLIGRDGDKWDVIFDEFAERRKVNCDAIADMAEDNFYEMRDRVADPTFQKKRELETKLEQTFADYFSKYSMVTFRDDLPYAEAKRLGTAQDDLLMKKCAEIDAVNSLDLSDVMSEIRDLHGTT